MNKASDLGRTVRFLRTTCLAAGLSTLVFPMLPSPADAQSAVTQFSEIPSADDNADAPAFSTSSAGKRADATVGDESKPTPGKKRKATTSPANADEPLNARAGRLTGGEDATLLEEPDKAERENVPIAPIDDRRAIAPAGTLETSGVRIGTFVLRPSLTTSFGSETTKSAGSNTSRTYSQGELKGTLTSDWSRHQLTITGEGIYQRNLAGDGQTDPSAKVDAELRLDLTADTVARITAGYGLSRESATDPDAVAGAPDQSAVQTLSAGTSIERDFGILRGLAALDLSRTRYGDVTLADGSKTSVADRDRNTGGLRLRVGYELSPALIPFLEASAGRTVFDRDTDALGYRRDETSYGGKGGVEVDLGEKLKGEIGLGYKRVTFADARLAAIDAVVLDAAANWSPRRGTDISIGLATTVEPSFEAGQSGYISRALTLALSQQIAENLVLQMNGGLTWRDYRPVIATGNEQVSTIGGGLTYGINRYLDVTGDISWERTAPSGGQSTDVLRAGLGLTLKR